ncbi:MAG: dihydroorotase [Candidatus Accumulibacter sp.]|jgi:dihydroorotase|nr:dihydroorotase [Accumulibacter sp.]
MRIEITRPDDWHLHLRDGDAMKSVLPHSARQFARAIVMPNLDPPVTSVDSAAAYRYRILSAIPPGVAFEPLMTLYLTDDTPPDEIRRAVESGFVRGVKLYPSGVTTQSDAGVTALEKCDAALSEMEKLGMPLLAHGEVRDPGVDVFDRESVFIETVLQPLLERHPALRVALEHITTKDAVDFVLSSGENLAATITAHHLLYNRNAIFEGGLRPHRYCLPLPKREIHRAALLGAATSGNPKFMLGTDSAPHGRRLKEADRGCAGCYTAHAALEFYAEAFESVGAIDRLEAFASFNGPDFYRLPRNTAKIALEKNDWTIPKTFSFGENEILIPLRAGEVLHWKRI